MAKRPNVKDLLSEQERLIAKDNAEIARDGDPFGLVRPDVEDVMVQERERGDFQQALKQVEVRRVFYRLMKRAGLWEADSDPNPVIMAHHAGRRSLAVDLFKAVKDADAGAIYQMEREYESDLKSKEKKPDVE